MAVQGHIVNRGRRMRWMITGSGFVLAVAATAGIIRWMPARPVSSATSATDDSSPGKNLEQVNSDFRKQAKAETESEEWRWITDGRINQAIDRFRELKPTIEAQRGKRERILAAMGHLLRTPGVRTRLAVDFLSETLKGDDVHRAGERLVAAQSLAEIGKAVPEYSGRAASAILDFWRQDDRPGPRGKMIYLLAELKSEAGFRVASGAISKASGDTAVETGLAYAFSEYSTDPKFRSRALARLDELGKKNPAAAPIVSKLLAYRGSSAAAGYVPALLKKADQPPSLEAAVFTIGKLRLKRYADDLRRLAKDHMSYGLANTFAEAFRELGMEAELQDVIRRYADPRPSGGP